LMTVGLKVALKVD
jgi:hypothetical protein